MEPKIAGNGIEQTAFSDLHSEDGIDVNASGNYAFGNSSLLSLTGHAQCNLIEFNHGDCGRAYLRVSSPETGHKITLDRDNGDRLLLDPKPDITPEEAKKLYLVVLDCCFMAVGGPNSESLLKQDRFEWIEANDLCRHFRKVKE